jgi:hypothetical protein
VVYFWRADFSDLLGLRHRILLQRFFMEQHMTASDCAALLATLDAAIARLRCVKQTRGLMRRLAVILEMQR